MDIKDSGTRRKFNSGAVRDMAEGKGRCDLLPLYEVSKLMDSDVLMHIYYFMSVGLKDDILKAIKDFCAEINWDIDTCILEVAKHFEQGANKYEERNWEKGIPAHCFIDSGVRHYLKWHRGDTDEPHDRAFVWNMICLLWTVANKPELNDLPYKEKLND